MATYNANSNFFILGENEVEFTIPEFLPNSNNPVPFNASIQGNGLANLLTGDYTDNLLNGRGGLDTLVGGFGDDIYVVWDSATIIRELAGDGTDYIQAFTSFVMPAHVEVLELNGSGDFTVVGNESDNEIYGSGGSNTLSGLAGNDRIEGHEGNDTLDGGTGSDNLVGGTGNDVFYVDSRWDWVTEQAGEGQDTVFTSSSFALNNSEIEILKAIGSAAASLTGNDYANMLHGNAGQNTLNGRHGNDTIFGGTGQDIFVFDATLGTSKTDRRVSFDKLEDFNAADSIWLDDAAFNNKALKLLGKKASEVKPKQLSSKFFSIGDKAKDKDDYIIYNKKTGVLSYDADGSGSKQAIEFAQAKKNLKLSYKDFFIV